MNQFRDLTTDEKAILNRLLSVDFPGRNQLLLQATALRARTAESDDEYGSLELVTAKPERANVADHIPVEAEAFDEDGIPIAILLHVRDGLLYELEIFKHDGSPIEKRPDSTKLKIIVNEVK